MSLNERISKIIEYSQLTPSEFADEIDVQRSSISHITSGRNKPSLEFIIKIKSRFPELMWDWLVTGEGEMLKSQQPETAATDTTAEEERGKPTPLPDLFTMMNEDDEFGSDEEALLQSPGESVISSIGKAQERISDSQQLENTPDHIISQAIGNQSNKIKRIVLFYENGKFESFEP
ncbi:XRE family transcriptional regulator [Chryseobacterium flavum]|uniref:XRE family transcriptional regulator n=1 Tax=Chryseobacterium flavum TaxID=415851 RepID=A0A3D9CJR0_9FLAO|nr:helix-turn-helix transcriptional regulator [Chryseobacterium flavum]REC65977.1 XRE family transcriptional regulator [Chryseobacterium flavum]